MRPAYDRELVLEFHTAFDLPVQHGPARLSVAEEDFRLRLLEEEMAEVRMAVLFKDPANLARELADVIYVAHGTGLVYGFPMQKVMQEVHRANMAKLGPDGQPMRRDDGKILKPEGWSPPDIKSILLAHGWDG